MLKSYWKTAVRFFLRNKTFSFINIVGLAIGTLCCLYILLFVQDQYSYDKHHQDAGDIYRITTSMDIVGDKHTSAAASPPIAPTLKRDFPEVLQFARLIPSDLLGNSKNLLRYQDKSFYETGLVYVDSTFFNLFSYHFDYGRNTRDLIAEPYTIVLSKATATKLFGNEDPVDKLISIDNAYGKHDFKVKGVVDGALGKTHIEANIFVTMRSGGFGGFVLDNTAWAGYNLAASYIRLKPGTNAAAFEKKLPAFLEKYGAQQLKSLGMTKTLHLQPVTSIHTSTGYEVELSKTVSPTLLTILALIAVMIQLIACINFMNLSTARASKRAREVGVRKVIGARKGDLIRQFLGESFLLSLVGVLLALPLLYFALPYLNGITQTEIHFSALYHVSVWLMLVGIVVVTGIVAGGYPAFYLSAFEAIKVMKGNFTNHISASGIRKSLVVFQFVLSIMLITGIVIIYSQLDYIKNKDLGFDKSQKLIFSFYTDDAQKRMTAFAGDLSQLAEVQAVGRSNSYLTLFVGRDHGVYLAGGNQSTAVDAQNMDTDDKFVKANGIHLIAGRDFHVNDSGRTLINETLCRRLGLSPDKAPGTRLYSQYLDGPINSVEVVGVMKDFNYNSLHGEVRPFMLFYNSDPGAFDFMTVSVNSTDYATLLAKIQAVWRRDLPQTPFEYAFLDQEVARQYAAEISLSRIINSFTVMAILISCLGLFGLTTFSVNQRRKELSIRKVLGANVVGVVALLSTQFVRLIVISFLIATPIAWWAMQKWLETFAYRVSLSWWMFALAGLLSLFIALATISFQAIRAALANPVKALRAE